jgi:hypothetical protein
MQVSEKIMQFWCSNFSHTDHSIHSCSVTLQCSSHSVQQSLSSYLSELPDFGLCTVSLKLFFAHVAFCVFLWMIGELVRTSLRRLLVTPDDPEFDNCGGAEIFVRNLICASPWEIWMVVDGWTVEGLPTCHCIALFDLWEPCVLYIGRSRSANIQMLHYIYFFLTNVSTEYFKIAAHSQFFSSKCLSFHNAIFFGSCNIHILHTGCAKI